MAQGAKTAAAATANEDEQSDITVIREQTRECLELLRALVALLVNKPEREGPTLEDLIAALVALQRDALSLLRQIAADQSAILDRLPAVEAGADGKGAIANGHTGRNGAHQP